MVIRKSDYRLWALAALALLAAGSMMAGLAWSEPASDSNSDLYSQLNLFGEVLSRVRSDYVEKPDDQKLVEDAIPDGTSSGRKLVEVVRVSSDAAVILVAPSRSLRRIPWLRLAEISSRRHLLTIEPGTSIESLEVAILDLMESLPAKQEYERAILAQLREVIGAGRRSRNISKFEMLYVSPGAHRG